MARRMGKRRSRGTWLPPQSITTLEQAQPPNGSSIGGLVFELAVPGDGSVATQIHPLTWDVPQQTSWAEAQGVAGTLVSLADMVGSGYYLRRIVGKVLAGLAQEHFSEGVADPPSAVLLGVGFFVARADDAIQNNAPVGDTLGYDVLNADNAREPWIWRRTWILGNQLRSQVPATIPDDIPAAELFPTTTAGYGSVLDGPHLDARTVRRVMNDDRLWVAISATRLITSGWFTPEGEVDTDSLTVTGFIDYRLFGRLARQRQTGQF